MCKVSERNTLQKEKEVNTMYDLIAVNYDNDRPTVSARELHGYLNVKTAFTDWFPRMCEYGFEEGKDFYSFLSESTGGRPKTEYQLTIEMAKEICMLQRSDEGKQARLYFIELEQKCNSPEMVMSRALQFSQKQIASLTQVNNALIEENIVMKPKADYYDNIIAHGKAVNFTDAAKLIGVPRNRLINELMQAGFTYRDGYGDIRAYQRSIDQGLCKHKQFCSDRNGHSGIQVLITPKGIEKFMQIMRANV